MATIGQVLAAPEAGWKRIDNRNTLLSYSSQFYTFSHASLYGGDISVASPGERIKFRFMGTKLRIISYRYPDRATNSRVIIDGVEEAYSERGVSGYQILVYEKQGLDDKEHTVEIVCGTDGSITMDAIDIDSTGRLLHLDEVTDIKDLLVGKRIRCHYQATANKVGTFSGLGEETSDFIPPASSAAPNGDFYFIMVEDWNGEKRLIADRNIQHSISWDTLNSQGIASGSGVEWGYNKDWDKLTNYFPFDEASGNITDSKGTAIGTVTGSTRVTGVKGNALSFNGTSNYAIFNQKITPVGKKSVRFKINFNDLSGNSVIVTNTQGSTGNGLQFQLYNGSLAVGLYANPTPVIWIASEPLVTGKWYDVLFTWDGTTDADEVKLYIDDMTTPHKTATATSLETATPTYNLTLGRHNALASGYLNGTLDELEIYNDVIDPNEIVPTLEDNEFTTRLMTGGISASDKDNEWDKYIVNSPLGNGNDIWNWNVPIYTRTSTTAPYGSAYRTMRGLNSNSTYSWDNGTSDAVAGRGFRPVLEVESIAVILPPAPVDIPTHLYKIESGLLFTDDFNSFHPRWVMSATDKYSLSDRPSYLRLKNDDRLDTFILSEIPTELFAIEVMTDYNPTEVGQQGGILVWKDNANKMEFLESYDSTQPFQQNNWMAVKEGINWTFLSDEGQGYNFVDTALIDANRFGIILKKQSGANSADLDIDKVIATRGNKMAVLNVKIGQIIQLTDTLGNVIVEHVLIEGSSMMFSLPRLEIEGVLNILEADRTLSNSISATFHGGDVYSIGTVMEVRIADSELSRISLTDLGAMNGGVLEVQMNVFNPTGDTVSDIELSISEYIDKFGWQWADVALDVSGVPGSYSDTIKIPSVDGGTHVNFWVKVARGTVSTGYNGIDDLQFNVHLKHA